MCKISILIPTYNRATLLLECLTSILMQTHSDLDVIIYDDGSTDGTENIIPKDSRINYVKNNIHNGISFARNELLKLSKCKYSCWQDSDDMSNIYRIEYQLQEITKNNGSFVSTSHTKLINNKEECFCKPTINELDRGGSFASVMFKTEESPKFIEGVDFGGEDVEWMNHFKKTNIKINIPYRLYYIRLSNSDRIGCMKLKYPEERRISNNKRINAK